MKTNILFVAIALIVTNTMSLEAFAAREELSDGSYVDEYGDIHDNKFENEDIFAPWNDPLLKDDIMAPWNDPLQQDDIFAPWNDPLAGPRETNQYLRESGERDSEYYWK